MENGEQLELDIDKIVFPGRGLSRTGGCVVFVPGVVHGERVRARVSKKKKNYAEAVLDEVIDASEYRIEPACPINSKCPGCCYQHVSYEAEVDIKRKQFINFIEHNAGMCAPADVGAVPSPSFTGYRNRITLHVAEDSNGPYVGYIGYDNRSIIDVPACPLACPEINELLCSLRSDRDFMESLPRDGTLMLRYSPGSGAYFLVKDKKHKRDIRAGVSLNYAREDTVIGTVKVPPGGFFQVNAAVMNMLLEYVLDAIGDVRPLSFIDVYCGSGLFAIAAASAGVSNVLGIESDAACVKAARENCREKGLENVTFLADAAGDVLGAALDCVELENTMALVDPTRRGLEKPVREALVSRRPQRIMYVSCAPDTMARDLKELAGAGYKIERARLFDMFPRTPYFESVVMLSMS
ncbi:MAG: class I SAM-dependent RNA methyltransferase [Verrucomicrobiota bacterium]